MRVAIDASILETPCPTGVERAAAALVRSLPTELAPGDEMFVLTHSPLPDAHPARGTSHARVEFLPLGGPAAPVIWRESHLAPALADLGATVLWSPVTAIPLRTRVPRVATFHEAPWLVRPGMEGRVREHAHRVRLRVAAQAAARIVCPSDASRFQFGEIHPGSDSIVRVVPHGIDERFLVPRDPRDMEERLLQLGVERPYMLHVGGNRPRKNVPLLLAAFARFRLRGGRDRLVVAGPGPTPPGLPRGVDFVGWVDDDDLLALYDGATALVLASESEGFGLPVLEAFARGTPVISTAVGGILEVSGRADEVSGRRAPDGTGYHCAALLVASGNPDVLADAMVRLSGDLALRLRLIERGTRRVEISRWDESARRLIAVLREVGSCA